jgi:hypothetical protein
MTTDNPTPPPMYSAGTPHPVQLTIPMQAEWSRPLAIAGCIFLIGRALLALPVLIVLYVLSIILGIGAWILQFAVLFTGEYPEGAHQFFAGIIQLTARAQAYVYGLSDRYPGFSLQ